jgi:hypothetical protein
MEQFWIQYLKWNNKMDELIKKLKSKSIVLLILSLLALTWQFLNYLTLKNFIGFYELKNSEIIIIYSGYFFFLVLFIAIISIVFTIFRVSMKYKSEKKKLEKEKSAIVTSELDQKKSL